MQLLLFFFFLLLLSGVMYGLAVSQIALIKNEKGTKDEYIRKKKREQYLKLLERSRGGG